ncbi:MAG: hypothetical protein HZC14_01975 [Candidatus Niyogibacteria bacterium]|nr:hypothetical protein [Candidatus Niyogibacteria bacterium]
MKFSVKYMREVLGVRAEDLGVILEIPDLGRRTILDSLDKKFSETTVAKLFALQEMLEYAENVFGDKKKPALWLHHYVIALGVLYGGIPLGMVRVSGIKGVENIRTVYNTLGQMKHGLYS